MRRLLPNDHLGVLLSPGCGNKAQWWPAETPWALDNGAFSGFNHTAFRVLLDRLPVSPTCLFVAAPDCVGNWLQTRLYWDQWYPELQARRYPLAYVLQDGQPANDVPWEDCAAVFVGGTDSYKQSQEVVKLTQKAKRLGKLVHMGRVNTVKRLRFAHSAGVDTIDGSKFSWYSDTYIPKFVSTIAWLTRSQQSLVLR